MSEFMLAPDVRPSYVVVYHDMAYAFEGWVQARDWATSSGGRAYAVVYSLPERWSTASGQSEPT